MGATAIDRQSAVDLLTGLVAIPSLSGQEEAVSAWLVEQMQRLGYDRAYVDAAGNAVGELGEAGAAHVVVLLGHIDTVPGAIPVRIEGSDDGPVLYGRSSCRRQGRWRPSRRLRLGSTPRGCGGAICAWSSSARWRKRRLPARRSPHPRTLTALGLIPQLA